MLFQRDVVLEGVVVFLVVDICVAYGGMYVFNVSFDLCVGYSVGQGFVLMYVLQSVLWYIV